MHAPQGIGVAEPATAFINRAPTLTPSVAEG